MFIYLWPVDDDKLILLKLVLYVLLNIQINPNVKFKFSEILLKFYSKEYLCSSDVREATTSSLFTGVQEHTPEEQQINVQVSSGTIWKLCDHHQDDQTATRRPSSTTSNRLSGT